MHTHQKSSDAVATIGIDIGKNTFHLVGLDKRGAIVLRTKVTRNQLERRLANVPCCLVGMEAGCGSHHIARQIRALGHDVRLIPAHYVRGTIALVGLADASGSISIWRADDGLNLPAADTDILEHAVA